MERNLLIGLVTRAQKGDSAAMDELFTAFYNDVYYFALKTVKDSDIACDITQETFLEIIKTIGSLKEPAAFVTWMKQITYHQCTRYFKKKKDVLVEENEDGSTVFDTLVDESEGSIPSEVYEKEEFRNTILDIINELTEQQRSAVMMYYFDELTVGQIAQIQGVSDGTVKSRLNYARKAIKKSVESYEKKHDIKLHSFSILPLLLLFFGKEHMPSAKAAEIQAVVSKTASAVGTGSAIAAEGIGAASVAASPAAAVGTGILTKIAALPIVTKIIAGIVAAAVVVGGGVALLGNRSDNGIDHKCQDADRDHVCDVCKNTVQDDQSSTDEDTAVCNGYTGGLLTCDQDGDWKCDVTGEPVCGQSHLNSHFDMVDADNRCDCCTMAIASMPVPLLVDDVLYIRPGVVILENGERSFDQVNVVYEIYNLDTGALCCTRSREEFPFTTELEISSADLYDACIKIPVSEITDAAVCNIGVRAKSLDENYGDSGFVGVEYTAASELEKLNVTIDDAGVLHIGNYKEEFIYTICVDVLPPDQSGFGVENGSNRYDGACAGGGYMPYAPQDGYYVLNVFEKHVGGNRIFQISNPKCPVVAIGASYLGNYETVKFYVSADEWASKGEPGPEPND